MSQSDQINPEPSLGERYEAAAFTFCKAGTLMLLLGKWALLVTAVLAALLYFQAHRNGCKISRCVLKYPFWIGAFWAAIALIEAYRHLHQAGYV